MDCAEILPSRCPNVFQLHKAWNRVPYPGTPDRRLNTGSAAFPSSPFNSRDELNALPTIQIVPEPRPTNAGFHYSTPLSPSYPHLHFSGFAIGPGVVGDGFELSALGRWRTL